MPGITLDAGALIGVFDIDSDQPAAFTRADADLFSALLTEVFKTC